jgi:aldehyde:ferredoxin oxidoreductase
VRRVSLRQIATAHAEQALTEVSSTMNRVFGYMDKLLRIKLDTGKISHEHIDQKTLIGFLGGRGVGAIMLYEELEPAVDPLSSENKLVFMTGPATGTIIPTANRTALVFKSPLTGGFAHSTVGGHFGPQLKLTGYDGIIIEEKSDKPVYISVQDECVEIKRANHLWGKDTFETEAAIRKEMGDETTVASIGIAGEKLSKMSNITVDFFRSFGRCGCGAVMGSKNLKALALCGRKNNVYVPDLKALEALSKDLYGKLRIPGWTLPRFGTAGMLITTNSQGVLPTKNFQFSMFDGAGEIGPEKMRREIVAKDKACFACPVSCSKFSVIKSGKHAGTKVEGPEYETLFALGAYCGNRDLAAITKANLLCDKMGLDTMSVGVTIGFAMECYQRGIINKQDTDGIDLTWGSPDAILALIEKIGNRDGFGDILADGVRVAAAKLGKTSAPYAMHVKGLEFAGYDPRGLQGTALGYATSSRGACHSSHYAMTPELSGKVDRFETKGKAEMVAELQDLMAVIDSLIICKFARYAFGLTFKSYAEIARLVTGIEFKEEDLCLIGERIFNVERLFNIREGIGGEDDKLPPRLTSEPIQHGPSKGHTAKLDDMLHEYYKVRGWDETGTPSQEKINELHLDLYLSKPKKTWDPCVLRSNARQK